MNMTSFDTLELSSQSWRAFEETAKEFDEFVNDFGKPDGVPTDDIRELFSPIPQNFTVLSKAKKRMILCLLIDNFHSIMQKLWADEENYDGRVQGLAPVYQELISFMGNTLPMYTMPLTATLLDITTNIYSEPDYVFEKDQYSLDPAILEMITNFANRKEI